MFLPSTHLCTFFYLHYGSICKLFRTPTHVKTYKSLIQNCMYFNGLTVCIYLKNNKNNVTTLVVWSLHYIHIKDILEERLSHLYTTAVDHCYIPSLIFNAINI